MRIIVVPDTEAMGKLAADMVQKEMLRHANPVIGLATGGTPLPLYRELIRRNQAGELDFSTAITFNLDEYVGLPPEHEQSYRHFMNRHLFDAINIDKANTHVPSGTATDYAAHCQEYEAAIVAAGGVDVQVLGIGSDGHIGFNEPGDSLCCRTHTVTLTEQTIDDNARFFEKKEDVPIYAITMGVGTILEAEEIVLVASGKAKAAAVASAVEGPVTSIVTASALQLHPSVKVFLDTEAAGELKMLDYYLWVQQKKPGAPRS